MTLEITESSIMDTGRTVAAIERLVDLIGDRTGKIVPIYPQSEKAQLSTWEIAGWVVLRRCAAPRAGRCSRRR